MSIAAIRKALEVKLAAMTPTVATVYENTEYTPVSGTPYQRANLLPAEPDNSTMGATYYREQGIFQVTLCYPTKVGPANAQSRADLLKTHFNRGTTMEKDGLTVIVMRTPAILPAYIDGDRYCIPVSIQYQCDVNL
jgi:hypothetical protein